MSSKLKTLFYRTFLVVLILVFVECSLRLVLCLSLNSTFLNPSLVITTYYPEILPLLQKPVLKDNSKVNILVLGGSTVSDFFCNTSEKLTLKLSDSFPGREIKIYNIAKFAQNSLDANIKLNLLKHSAFDYVIYYEAINDIRANNCPDNLFDSLYRHIDFYRQINIIISHPEINVTVIPFVIDFCFDKILTVSGARKSIPKEFYKLDEKCNCLEPINKYIKTEYIEYGNNIKTMTTYKRNLDQLYRLTVSSGAKFVLLTYAFYLPRDYTLKSFLLKRARLSGKYSFPIEMWGKAGNVIKALNTHNEIIQNIAKMHSDILYSDFNKEIEKTNENFIDVCHLTDAGCTELTNSICGCIIKGISN